jgi:hypothetical protein
VWAGYSCHHRQLRSGGGADTPGNLIMLCGSGSSDHCHLYVHAHSEEARREGWIVSRHALSSPAGVPVRHWQLGMVYLADDGRVISMAELEAARDDDDGR